MKNRTLESDFSVAITELSTRPISNLFLFKSRVLGAMINVAGLREDGWNAVFGTNTQSLVWQDCLWFDKLVVIDEGTIRVRISTSQPLFPDKPAEDGDFQYQAISDEESIRRFIYGEKEAPAFLRSVHFYRDLDGGLRRQELLPEVPRGALDAAEKDLSKWTMMNWNSFSSDLKYQTCGRPYKLPPHVFETPFTAATAALNGLLLQEEQQNHIYAFERLLVRLVRTIADIDYDPEAKEKLEAFPDGLALWNYVHFWFAAAPHDGAAARLLAWALSRAADLSEPFSAICWSGLSYAFGCMGFFREGVLAADRALDCPGSDERHAGILWETIVFIIRHYYAGKESNDKPINLGWLIQILFSREDQLRDMDGYWTLLGLALAANGNGTDAALKTMQKSFEERVEDRDDSEDAPPPPHIRHPRDWQAITSVWFNSTRNIRNALAAFPDPLLSKEWTKETVAQHVVTGMADFDFLEPIMDFTWNGKEASIDLRDCIEKTEPVTADEWNWLSVPEISPASEGFVVAVKMRRYREPDAELELFFMEGACDPGNSDTICCRRILPFAKPKTPNVVIAPWEFYPYADNCCGEIRFRCEGGEHLTGASVYFPADRYCLPRGVPSPGYVYALPLLIRHAERMPTVTIMDGITVNLDNSRILFEHNSKDSEALYEFHGKVDAIRRVRVSAGGELLCLDMDVGTRLPCKLPVYVREDRIEGDAVQVGDILDGILFLQVDFFPPDDHSKAWIETHPDGPGDEPRTELDFLHRYTVSFRKRSPTGKNQIAVLGGRPGETVEKDDTSPTPESFNAVENALRRLRDAFGCEEVVRWSPNPDGIDLSARVHGLVLKYHVVKVVGHDEVKTDSGWDPDEIQTLIVRLLDDGSHWKVEYENFPLLRPPETADKSGFYCADASKASLEYLLAEGRTGGLGYDMENIVDMAASCGAQFLDAALTKLEKLGVNVNFAAHAHDKEGFCAVQLHRDDKACCEVFRKHGVDLGWTVGMAHPSSDVYDLRMERIMVENSAKAGREHPGGDRGGLKGT